MTTTNKNIFQRMLAIQSELGYVAKNLNVATSKTSSYKATGEVDVLNAVKPLEEKYGVYSYASEREIVESDTIVSKTQYGEKSNFYMRLKTVYRFVNIDDPKDYIEVTSYADGIDSGDKATGKAMTYADKYALMKAYKISTGDDPDQQASQEYTTREKLPQKGNLTANKLNQERQEKLKYIAEFYKAHTVKFEPILKPLLNGRKLSEISDKECDGLVDLINKSQATLAGVDNASY